MDRFDPFVKYADVYGDIINWEKDPMNKPQNQNKYFFSDGKTYYEQICKMLRLMSVFKEAFNQIYSNEDEISEAWENFVNNLSASVVEGSEPDVTLTWTDDSVNFEFTMVPGVPGEQGVGITSISFNSDYTMTITLSNGQTYTSMSLKGETGPQGPQGETGSGLQILDVYATPADLQSAHPTGQPGDAYQVGSAGNYTLYIWSSSQSAWVQAGSLGTVSPSVSNPLMDGTASAGSSDLYSRGDHVHPSDTSRASQEELDALIKTSQALIAQSFTYRESPAIQDGLARIDKIKGNTLVWNQLIQNGNFADTSNWSAESGVTLSISNNIATISSTTANNGIRQYFPYPLTVGHKYLIKAEFNVPTEYRCVIGTAANQGVQTDKLISTANTWTEVSGIGTCTVATTSFYCYAKGTTYENVKIRNVMCFDLTQMELDISNPSDFTSLFSLPYYAYNQGTLLSFMGNGIKTTGKNLFDFSQFANGTITFENGVLTGTAAQFYTSYGDVVNAGIELKYPKNTQITISFDARTEQNDGTTGGGLYLSASENGSSVQLATTLDNSTTAIQHITVTIPSNRYIDKLGWTYGSNGQNIWHITNFQVEFGATETSYEPYTSSTLSLPISTYFPTGMKSARNVYDELTESKATTRVSRVDLGSLVWTLRDNAYWQTQSDAIPDAKKPSDNVQPINAIHSIYEVKGGYYVQGVNQIGMTTTGVLNCNNGSTTDKPSGYLYYELATPVETDVDLDLSFIAYEDGTEQLLPVNGSVPSTSPIIADMTYLSIDDAMEYILEKLANVPQNTQQILESLEDDVADLQTDVGTLQPAVSGLQTSVGNINTNIGQLSSTVAGHTASISEMQSDITDLNTGLSDLEDTVTDNTSRIGTLETDLASTDGQVQNLATSVSGLDSTVTAQGETVTALDNFVSNIANTRNPGYMSSDNSIGITSAFLNMTLAAGQSTWANIPLPTIMAGFIPLFVVGAATGDGSVCLFKIPSTYNQNNIYRVGVKNTSNSEVTTQVSIEILCIKQRQSQ